MEHENPNSYGFLSLEGLHNEIVKERYAKILTNQTRSLGFLLDYYSQTLEGASEETKSKRAKAGSLQLALGSLGRISEIDKTAEDGLAQLSKEARAVAIAMTIYNRNIAIAKEIVAEKHGYGVGELAEIASRTADIASGRILASSMASDQGAPPIVEENAGQMPA